jgi:hypothetical protein
VKCEAALLPVWQQHPEPQIWQQITDYATYSDCSHPARLDVWRPADVRVTQTIANHMITDSIGLVVTALKLNDSHTSIRPLHTTQMRSIVWAHCGLSGQSTAWLACDSQHCVHTDHPCNWLWWTRQHLPLNPTICRSWPDVTRMHGPYQMHMLSLTDQDIESPQHCQAGRAACPPRPNAYVE